MPWPDAEPPLDAELTRVFAPCLPGGRLAGPLRAYRSLASTQTLARAWAATGAPEGTVVLADHQTAGRGRHGRSWTAPGGTALLFSVVLRPRLPVARWPRDPAGDGLRGGRRPGDRGSGLGQRSSGRTTCSSAGGSWRASCAERSGRHCRRWSILGIGVNVSQRDPDWPPDLAATAGSLASLGASVARETLLAALLVRLAGWYGVLLDEGFEPVRAAWRRRGLLGLRVPAARRRGHGRRSRAGRGARGPA